MWFVLLIICFALQGNPLLAQENPKKDSGYSIPAELKPVWTWKNGYSAKETQYFRRAYLPDSGVTANDIGYVSPETDTVVVWYSSAYKAEIWVHAYAREIVKQVFRKK